jgi:DNA polymerase-1
MPGPLLAVDAPSLMYRAYFALPSSIKGADGRPVNALLGMANLVLREHERSDARAVVLCWGAEAAAYRKDAFPAYHADRPPMPDDLAWQWERAPGFFAAFGWPSLHAGDLEADDLLGALADAEGGETLLFTGDRDMFQCVGEHVRVLFPGGKDGPAVIDADAVRERYGIEPEQVPDFIALRGDPSDGLPGAKGIGEKGAAQLLRDHGSLEALLELAARADTRPLKGRAVVALREQADELRAFRDIATLRPVAVERPADAPLDRAAAAAAARELGMARLADRLEGGGA